MDNKLFSWIPFYEELADKLLDYKSNRKVLIKKIRHAHKIAGVSLTKLETDNNNIPDIDPFTVFSTFNRGKQGLETRKMLCKGYKQVFEMNNGIPSDFEGIPTQNYTRYCFYPYLDNPKREKHSFDVLWKFFAKATKYDFNSSTENKDDFVSLYDTVMKLPEVGPSKITIALFQVRPNIFISIDKNTKPLISRTLDIPDISNDLTGDQYLSLCSKINRYLNDQEGISLPEYSSKAYALGHQTANKNDDGWFPRFEQYHPKLTKEDWLGFMNESGKFRENYKHLLAAMNDIGGQATCVQLEQRYGKSAASYNLTATNFAMAVQSYTNCECWIDENGEKNYWSIPFIGRKTQKGEDGKFVWKIRTELKEALNEYGLSDYSDKSNSLKKGMTEMIPKNIILYGPPGTGKTYSIKERVEEISGEEYEELAKSGRLKFVTFHQSYGYEEFVEGIKPSTDETDSNGNIKYSVEPGIFKKFCDENRWIEKSEGSKDYPINDNPKVWKVSLKETGDNDIRKECLENDHIRIGWDEYGENITDDMDYSAHGGKNVLSAFINKMRIGDIVLSCYSSTTIDAVGIVKSNYRYDNKFEEYKRVRDVEWLIKYQGKRIFELNHRKPLKPPTVYELKISADDVLRFIEKDIFTKNSKPCFFIIDEINRGNISKIFGELITLIEESKRDKVSVTLPYSGEEFTVPSNVYVIGTMNTADRSIALLDTALRRRFDFEEMMPDPENLTDDCDGVNLKELLRVMNERIEYLLDREHTIGHAYFMESDENGDGHSINSLVKLKDVFKKKIIPLLQEYFYDDYEKIGLVLGGQFVKEKNVPNSLKDKGLGKVYEINLPEKVSAEVYKSIYNEDVNNGSNEGTDE